MDHLQLGQDMRIQDRISRDKMLEILEDIAEMGVRAVTFSGGGDPFFYPFLLDAVQFLAKSPVQFASLTNGARLEGELAEVFAHHATWLRVSMDGWDDASYTRYRGAKPGEYTRILNNLENFAKLGGSCFLGVSLIIDKDNAAHVFEMIQRLQKVGVQSVKISPCIVSNDGAESNAYHQPHFNTVQEQVGRAQSELAGDGLEIFNAYHHQLESFEKSYDWCPYLQILPVIGADLNVYSCQDKAYNLDSGVLGSLQGIRFRDFWENGREKFFRINPSQDCRHHCVAHSKNTMILNYLDTDSEHLAFV